MNKDPKIMLKFITGNKQKFIEVQRLLAPIKIQQLKINLDEIQDIDPKRIIRHKLKEAFKHHAGPFIIEDDSVTFDALGGKLPGPFIKWFNDYLGTNGMSALVRKSGKLGAEAISFIAFAKNISSVVYFLGRVKGKIVRPKGTYRFGYDEIFLPQNSKKTFSQQKAQGDFSRSPRGIAVGKLKKFLSSDE